MVTHTILVISVLAGYVANFERYGIDEESITAVELRDYDVLGIAGEGAITHAACSALHADDWVWLRQIGKVFSS